MTFEPLAGNDRIRLINHYHSYLPLGWVIEDNKKYPVLKKTHQRRPVTPRGTFRLCGPHYIFNSGEGLYKVNLDLTQKVPVERDW